MADRDQQLSDLVVSLQQFVTGLAGDRDAIFDSLQTIDTLADDHQRLPRARRARRWPPTSRRSGTSRATWPTAADLVEHFLQLAPTKIDLITRTAINGSWFNFFMCSADGTVTLPATGLPGNERRPAVPVADDRERRGGVQLMARESKPFRDRNPVTIGAISLARHRGAGVPRLQRAVACRSSAAAPSTRRSSPRRPACSPTTRCGSPA